MTLQYKKFRDTLDELFMLDHAELDFGIYRIMNQKRADIADYLDNQLEEQVTQLLKSSSAISGNAEIKELAELESTLKKAGLSDEEIAQRPNVQQLKAKLKLHVDPAVLEDEVYNHLSTFFKRYYDGGDFMSMRRYKRDVYAIPYEGEEVKLHWANSDQYYIKTSEYFQNYTFKADDKTIHFALRDASTEQNNNKSQNDKERFFKLCEEDYITEEDGELTLWFTYETMAKKRDLQKILMKEALDTIITTMPTQWGVVLFRPMPTEKNKTRTLLEKHLNDYVSRNSFDYFIHKDLGGFLRRELDFYIKNEVLFIDDISTEEPERFLTYLSQIKTIKNIGEKLITFLAQLEDFQKKLWLKKKFVVESNYCITLDRVPNKLYAEIAYNDKQRKEWVRLFAIDEIEGDGDGGLFDDNKVGYTSPLTVEFLEQNPFLVLDTAFFDDDFKQRLISSIDNIDEQLDGTLINSENFQALNLLQEKYHEQVKCIYIDPPYNTGGDGFVYKDNYKHSSWLSMMTDRLKIARNEMLNDGVIFISINDKELIRLIALCNQIFMEENFVGLLIWKSRQNKDNRNITGLSVDHEYVLCYSNNSQNRLFKGAERKVSQYTNPDNDVRGAWVSGNMVGILSEDLRPNCHYDLIDPNTGINYGKPKMGWRYDRNTMNRLISENRILWPEKIDGRPRRKVFLNEISDELPNFTSIVGDNIFTRNGTKTMQDVFNLTPFSYPKPFELILELVNQVSIPLNDNVVFDFFAGSGTTAHAVINLNREDKGNRKYILVEMGTYFDTVTKPRVQKVIYSKDWKDGKPVSREGSSHCFKYLRLESYEDTLNNLMTKEQGSIDAAFGSDYLLGYMLDVQMRGSLFNKEWFVNPFDFKLKITAQNELQEQRIDLIETFNYLIGLNVEAVQYPKEGLCVVEGITRRGAKTLILWRDCSKINNEELNKALRKLSYNTLDTEFDTIYVNGDNTLQNQCHDKEHWKVNLIEEAFASRMFE